MKRIYAAFSKQNPANFLVSKQSFLLDLARFYLQVSIWWSQSENGFYQLQNRIPSQGQKGVHTFSLTTDEPETLNFRFGVPLLQANTTILSFLCLPWVSQLAWRCLSLSCDPFPKCLPVPQGQSQACAPPGDGREQIQAQREPQTPAWGAFPPATAMLTLFPFPQAGKQVWEDIAWPSI